MPSLPHLSKGDNTSVSECPWGINLCERGEILQLPSQDHNHHTKHILLFSLKKLHLVEAAYLLLQYKTDICPPFCFLQIFAYMNENSSRKEKWDLQALRFLSINSIIDPWVFAILRPPVLRLLRSVLCCRVSLRTQEATQASCSTQSNASKQIDLWGW